MSAAAKNYVYQVTVTDKAKKEATISPETLKEYREEIGKYIKKDGRKN